jgi:predicted Na+-dependent transporter
VLTGLTWLGAQARWVLAVGVVLATFLPSLSSALRPFLPGLVVLVLCISMARLDLGLLARRASKPRRMAALLGWTVALLVVTPAVIWVGASAAGLPAAHVAALVYTFAAPPISSAPALCLLLGLEAGFALELTVVASLATPFIGPVVTKALLGETVPLDAFDLALRVAAMIAGGVVAALVVRRLFGPARIARHGGAFDGVATAVLLLFVIPLFDGFWDVVLNLPWFAFGTLALVLVANWGAQVVVAVGIRRAAPYRGGGPGLAGSVGLMWGNRNVSIYFAALPPDPLFGLYVAFYQLPMLFTPLVLGWVLRDRE